MIAVAPTGAYRQKTDHPALPLSPRELADAAEACVTAGACLIHLHVRDRQGVHTLDVEIYRRTITAIRQRVGDRLVIQVTSEAGRRFGPEQQMATIRELRPESASFAIRELVPDAASEAAAADFFSWSHAHGVLGQFVLYSRDDLLRFQALRKRGVIPGKRHFLLFVLGKYTDGQQSHPAELLPFVTTAAADDVWAVCAFGRLEAAAMMAAAALGGHVRVGFENNLLLKDGRIAPDNAALVGQAGQGAGVLGREIATAADLRAMLTP